MNHASKSQISEHMTGESTNIHTANIRKAFALLGCYALYVGGCFTHVSGQPIRTTFKGQADKEERRAGGGSFIAQHIASEA
jgi:hypothetical protein